jgi:hypothetical protein
MKSLKPLMALYIAGVSFAALPAMAQSNAAPGNPTVTGYQGGKITTPEGKTVYAPPRPAPGSNGGDNSGGGGGSR